MKITKANLETLRYSERTGKYYKGNNTYIRNEACSACGEPFLQSTSNKGTTCSPACRRKGLHHSEETKNKIGEANKINYANPENHPWYGKHHTEKSKEKMRNTKLGKKHTKEHNQKIALAGYTGGYYKKGIPRYENYAPQLEWFEKVRKNKEDKNILEVKCFKCGKWYIPDVYSVINRIRTTIGKKKGEHHFYCSPDCKNNCYIFNKKPETLMHEDEWRAGRDSWWDEPRHMQGQWRELVLERDNYTCQKCGSKENLKAHHIKPVKLYPLESCDVDNGIILCGECHNKAHHIAGCSTGELAKLC